MRVSASRQAIPINILIPRYTASDFTEPDRADASLPENNVSPCIFRDGQHRLCTITIVQ